MKPADRAENAGYFEDILLQLNSRLSRIEATLTEPRQPVFNKEWYAVAEAAEVLGKAPFTVREWARLGRINASKRPSGRGKASEWMISHREVERIQNKGLLPRNM